LELAWGDDLFMELPEEDLEAADCYLERYLSARQSAAMPSFSGNFCLSAGEHRS
jgi:hypothetical protein